MGCKGWVSLPATGAEVCRSAQCSATRQCRLVGCTSGIRTVPEGWITVPLRSDLVLCIIFRTHLQRQSSHQPPQKVKGNCRKRHCAFPSHALAETCRYVHQSSEGSLRERLPKSEKTPSCADHLETYSETPQVNSTACASP